MEHSNIKLKHKVQLRRKSKQRPKSKPIIWIVIAIIMLCLIGYFIFSKPDNNLQPPVVIENKSTADESSIPADTSTTDKDAIEEADNNHTNKSSSPLEHAESEESTIMEDADNSSASEIVVVSDDIETEALKVIRGDYGVGQERKDKPGEKYQPIQNRVNELKREGLF